MKKGFFKSLIVTGVMAWVSTASASKIINIELPSKVQKPIYFKGPSVVSFAKIPAAEVNTLLGSGYNTLDRKVLGECIASQKGGEGIEVAYVGSNSMMMNVEDNLDDSKIRSLMNVEAEGSLSYGMFKFEMGVNLGSNLKSDEYSRTYALLFNYTGRTAVIRNPQKSKTLLNLENGPNPKDAIKNACGNEFINEVELGAKLLVAIKIRFSNSELASNFKASGSVSVVDLFSVKGLLDTVATQYKNSASIKLTAFQLGGIPSRLGKLLGSSGGNSNSGIFDCSINDLEKCNKALSQISKYVSEPGGFSDQVEQCVYSNNAVGGCTPIAYASKSYSDVGVTFDLEPDPGTTLVIENIRNQLFSKLERELFYFNKAEAFLKNAERLVDEEKINIEDQRKKAKNNIDLISKTSNDCFFKNYKVCMESNNTLEKNWIPLDSNLIKHETTFLDFCLGVNIYDDEKLNKMVYDSATKIKNQRKSTCEETQRLIEKTKYLNLDNTEIETLIPLRAARNIENLSAQNNRISQIPNLYLLKKLKRLDLKNNLINSLNNLDSMPQLEYLNLRSNKISTLDTVYFAQNLKFLDLSNNDVQDVCPLTELPVLQELRLQGNPRRKNICDLNKKQSLKFLKTEQTICEAERKWLLDSNMIDRDDYEYLKKNDLAAVYNTPGVRSSGLTSVAYKCQSYWRFLDPEESPK